MNKIDWNQTRGFLATAETGTLSEAARKLGLTQPTLSRQVAALEADLGVTLFERVGKTLILTETGHALLDHARKMGEAADAMTLSATGHSEAVSGLVRISASDGISAYILTPILKRVHREAPQIRIEVVASNEISDLQRREADIAIRHVRPTQPELIGKFIRDGKAGFYASDEWVQRNGRPRKPEDIKDTQIIGFDPGERYEEHLRGIGFDVSAANFPFTSENSVVLWEMVRQGLGVTIMMEDVADKTPGVTRILDDVDPIEFPIWLVTHRELHTSRRIRIVFDILAEELASAKS